MMVWILALLIVLIIVVCRTSSEEEHYYNTCETSEECRWDTARWCTMTDGTQGNCTLNSLCCPAFSMAPLGPQPQTVGRPWRLDSGLTIGDEYLRGQ